MTKPQLETFICIEMAQFPAASLTGTFQAMNAAAYQTTTSSVGFQYDIKILKIYNDGTSGFTISYDGVTPNDYLPSKGTMIVDLQTNHDNIGGPGGHLVGRQGQLVWGMGSPGGAFNIYISGYL